jgi:hypothetical protein
VGEEGKGGGGRGAHWYTVTVPCLPAAAAAAQVESQSRAAHTQCWLILSEASHLRQALLLHLPCSGGVCDASRRAWECPLIVRSHVGFFPACPALQSIGDTGC